MPWERPSSHDAARRRKEQYAEELRRQMAEQQQQRQQHHRAHEEVPYFHGQEPPLTDRHRHGRGWHQGAPPQRPPIDPYERQAWHEGPPPGYPPKGYGDPYEAAAMPPQHRHYNGSPPPMRGMKPLHEQPPDPHSSCFDVIIPGSASDGGLFGGPSDTMRRAAEKKVKQDQYREELEEQVRGEGCVSVVALKDPSSSTAPADAPARCQAAARKREIEARRCGT